MKKLLLTLGVACMALPTFAATRVLYQQNFETATDPASIGWSYGGASISIASDEYGKFLELNQGQTNGRSAKVTWGQDIFMKDGAPILEDGKYNLKFDFSIAQGSNNQYNTEFTIFTNHAPIDNQTYRLPWNPAGCWDNYLFDMSQVDKEPLQFAIDGATIENKAEDGTVTYAIDYSSPTTFDARAWYTVDLNVDVESREVEYSVVSLTGDIVKSGTRTVPETDVNGDPISMYAEGLFIMVARYATIIDIDNIVISCETAAGFANAPTIALTRLGKTADEEPEVDLNLRAYTITFLDGETLNVTGTDGQTVQVEFADCEGAYEYETTKSGTLTAWTTCDGAESDKVSVEVDCAPVVLPEVNVAISAVGEGFVKTYTLTVSNESVPLRPTVFIDYEFTGVSGEKIAKEGEASGCKVTVTEEGTLKVTSAAFGYESTTASVKNELQFETKKAYDFARLTEEEIKAAGFPSFTVLNSDQTSGFNNWTARKRLYYNIEGSQDVDADGNPAVDGDGNPVPVKAFPFGFVAADNTTNVIQYSVIDNTGKESVDANAYFKGLTIFPDKGKKADGFPNVCMMYRIGLFNNETNNNNNNVIVNGLDKDDFVVVNAINNYGGNSNHPTLPEGSDNEYYKLLAGEDAVYSVAAVGTLDEETGTYSVTHPLYRIDTAITKITVYKPLGSSAVESVGVETEVEGDNWYYSIDGVRMAQPTRPGIYIHKGKKIIIK